jgi:BlaI family penicillinase repressor
VLKTLQIMETKGYVTHSRAGRAYVYRPSIRREHHVRGRLRELLQGLIGQDRLELINTLLDEASLTGKELDEVRGMLAARGRRRT